MRCFAAIEVPEPLRQALLAAGDRIRRADTGWADQKWVSAANLHVTLAFLAAVDPDELEPLVDSVRRAARSTDLFVMRARRLDAIPGEAHARMLWLSVDGGPAFESLTLAIHERIAPFDPQPIKKPIRPHITVCRARKPMPVRGAVLESANRALDAVSLSMSVPSVTVFTSRLTPRGPIYEPVEVCRLRGG